MSNDTHLHHETPNEKPSIQFRSAFYFVIIIAGLFIAAIAFVQSMSHTEEAHGAHATEATHDGASSEHHEAPASEEAHH